MITKDTTTLEQYKQVGGSQRGCRKKSMGIKPTIRVYHSTNMKPLIPQLGAKHELELQP